MHHHAAANIVGLHQQGYWNDDRWTRGCVAEDRDSSDGTGNKEIFSYLNISRSSSNHSLIKYVGTEVRNVGVGGNS